MTDRLDSICGPSDLSPADLERLLVELRFIEYVLGRISSGSGFCGDRGYDWGIEQERAEGSERMFASLRAWPILRRLLPGMRHYLHQTDPVIGLGSIPYDDAVVAVLVVENTWSFAGRFGEGLEERTIAVAFEADCIRVSERVVAGNMSDGPSDARQDKFAYDELANGAFWAEIQTKLPKNDGWSALALGQRMQKAVVPCDLCGRTVQTLAIEGSNLIVACQGGDTVSAKLERDTMLSLRRALAAQDLPAILAFNPSGIVGYDAGIDASYCMEHRAGL